MNRAKLVALGVPRARLPGTGWLLLFFKAAAAGWRSYSIGGTARLGVQPHRPLLEVGFVTRLLCDSALRRVGSPEPALARGTIAFDPMRHPGRFRGLPRVLVVSPYLPYPLSHGGAVRIYNLCRALSGRVDFVLAAFRETGDWVHYERLYEVFREIYVVDRDERPSRDKSLPEQVRNQRSASMRALIAPVCREATIDLVQIEYAHLADLRDAAPGVPAILVEHDVTFALYRQLAEREPTGANHREYQRWCSFESAWFRRYDSVWTMSEADRAVAIRAGSMPARTVVVPNGVDIERFIPCCAATEDPEIFYVGSFRHLPNILGFQKLRDEIMPRVWRYHPRARLRVIAGSDHKRHWREFLKQPYPETFDPRIAIHAFVEDLRPLYAAATVVTVPLPVSAGTNIKVMEALACGKAVISTPVGCAGLGLRDGVDVVIRAEWSAFADAVMELLENCERRESIAAEGRHTVEQHFGWTAIAERAWESYRDNFSGVAGRKKAQLPTILELRNQKRINDEAPLERER